jgi:hypothetical protein
VLIAILVFVVLGAFVAAEAPRSGSNPSSAALKQNPSPASVHHAKPIKGTKPGIHSHGGSNDLNKDAKTGHHAG